MICGKDFAESQFDSFYGSANTVWQVPLPISEYDEQTLIFSDRKDELNLGLPELASEVEFSRNGIPDVYNQEIRYEGIGLASFNNINDTFCYICNNEECQWFAELDYDEERDQLLNRNTTGKWTNRVTEETPKLILPKVEFDFSVPSYKVGGPVGKSQQKNDTCNLKESGMYLPTNSSASEKISKSPVKNPEKLNKKAKNESDCPNSRNLFLIRRAWFRGFSEYFKNKFSVDNYSWQRKRGNKTKKVPIISLVRKFAESEFSELLNTFSDDQYAKFEKTLLVVLFSQRYKKNDEFLKDIDFSRIRNVLYRYTTEARHLLMKDPQMCFLIHHFYSNDWHRFIQSKIDEKTMLNTVQLKSELSILDEDTYQILNTNSPF